MSHVTSVGLDVHARSVAACAFDPFTGEATRRSFGADPGEIAEWILPFDSPKAVYESGPTGFHLCRSLRALGVDCVVGAVSRMQKPAADKRVKNDRRDAAFLARLLATHNVVEVAVPDEATEAARDLSRALDAAREDVRRARQRLDMFLVRRGHVWDERDALGRRLGAWTRAWWRWAGSIRFEEAGARQAFDHYATCVRCAESDKRALEKQVWEASRDERWRARVDALGAVKGVDCVTAFCLVAEAGVFSRFPTAGAYASWLGLAPSEHSSGETESRGGITKTGNRRCRRALIGAAWHFASCSPAPKAPEAGRDVDPAVRRRCDACTRRLSARHAALRAAGKRPNVANVAVARELACWAWEIGRRVEGTLA